MTQPLNDDVDFNDGELSFLLEKKSSLFQELFLEEDRYRTIVFALQEHRRPLLSEAWPRLEKAGIKFGENRPMSEIEDIVGPAAVRQLKVITSAIISNTDENVKSLADLFRRLRVELKNIFPKQKFIDLNFEETNTP